MKEKDIETDVIGIVIETEREIQAGLDRERKLARERIERAKAEEEQRVAYEEEQLKKWAAEAMEKAEADALIKADMTIKSAELLSERLSRMEEIAIQKILFRSLRRILPEYE